ncbi:MAG: glycosyltransferase family 2 protein [Saprospiraceae bacterium]|nr:glycosyltransferase family 2 protein [Saprospiraceae bacterium]
MNISVIIPVFNASCFLDKSIGSALSQSETAEVILIDDRSDDGSLDICKRWESNDSRVRVFVNEGIKGAGAARNVGLSNASCEFIAFWMRMIIIWKEDLKKMKCFLTSIKIYLRQQIKSEIKTPEGKEQFGLNSVFKHNESIAFQKSNAEVNIYDFFKGSALHLNGLTYKSN